jgi:hypothetical protein
MMEERDFKMKYVRSKRERLIFCVLATFILLGSLIFPACAAGEWKVSPSNPAVGDTVTITGPGGKSINAEISVLVKVPVVGGRYKLPLPSITVPNHRITNNRITARAEGVQNMHLAVKKGLTFNKDVTASGGVATISASNVPPLTYSILIDGDALSGRSVVNLVFTASGTLTALSTDPNGDSKYSFDTSSLPAGKLTVNVGGSGQTGGSQTIDLKPTGQTGSAQSVSTPSLTTRLKQMFSSYWKR